MKKGVCRACGERVEFQRPRGWNLCKGLVAIRCSDGKHTAYLNPSHSYTASCQLAAINSEAMASAGEYHVHGHDYGETVSCL